jgi:exportin-2 (importin alpha re-exporter)
LVLANIEPVLGVFQKLIASVKTDHDGITLLCTILEYIPMAGLMKYIVQIFNVMFTRMKARSSDKFKALVAVYCAHFASKHGFTTLTNALNAIQPNMAEMIIGNVMIPSIPNVSNDVQKKTIACGVVVMLLRTPEFQQPPWLDKWPLLLQSTIQMYEAPIIPGDDDDDLLEVTMKSFNTTFAKLAFAGMKEFDPNPTVALNGRDYLVNQLKAVAPQIGPLVGKISPVAQAALSKYLAA